MPEGATRVSLRVACRRKVPNPPQSGFSTAVTLLPSSIDALIPAQLHGRCSRALWRWPADRRPCKYTDSVDRADWDRRYLERELVWSAEPNRCLVRAWAAGRDRRASGSARDVVAAAAVISMIIDDGASSSSFLQRDESRQHFNESRTRPMSDSGGGAVRQEFLPSSPMHSARHGPPVGWGAGSRYGSGCGSSGRRSRPTSPGWSGGIFVARNDAYGTSLVAGGCHPGHRRDTGCGTPTRSPRRASPRRTTPAARSR